MSHLVEALYLLDPLVQSLRLARWVGHPAQRRLRALACCCTVHTATLQAQLAA